MRRRAATPTTRASIYGLAKKAENEDVRILTGVKVTGFKKDNKGAVKPWSPTRARSTASR